MNDRKKCPWCMEYACDHRKEMWELKDNIRRLETENAELKTEAKIQLREIRWGNFRMPDMGRK